MGVVAVGVTVTSMDFELPAASLNTSVAAPPLTPFKVNALSVTVKVATLTSLLMTLKGAVPPLIS